MIAWQEYTKNKEQGTSIADGLGAVRSRQIESNRHYLKAIAEVLLLCSQQEIVLRGHNESAKSMNRGNFLEILTLLASHDQVIKDRITSGPRNATYTSPDIQNTLLHIMCAMVQSVICSKINKAGIYRTGRFIGEDFILAIGDLFNFSPIFKTPTKYIRYDTPTIISTSRCHSSK